MTNTEIFEAQGAAFITLLEERIPPGDVHQRVRQLSNAGRRRVRSLANVRAELIQSRYKKAAGRIANRIIAHGDDTGRLTTMLRDIELDMGRLSRNISGRVEKTIGAAFDQSFHALEQSMTAVYGPHLPSTINTQVTSRAFQRIHRSAVRALLTGPDGVSLSSRVWNTHQMTLTRMRSYIVNSYLAGKPGNEIAQGAKRFLIYSDADMRTTKWKTFFKENPPGRGVYKSASKNVDRVMRTEINSAYRLATAEYAADKAWIQGVRWHIIPGHKCCDECVPAGTKISTVTGQRNIEDIEVGEMVLTHTGKHRKVTKTFERTIQDGVLVDLVFESEKGRIHRVTMTPNHPVLIDRGWISASDLLMGEHAIAYSEATHERAFQIHNGVTYKETECSERSVQALDQRKDDAALCGAFGSGFPHKYRRLSQSAPSASSEHMYESDIGRSPSRHPSSSGCSLCAEKPIVGNEFQGSDGISPNNDSRNSGYLLQATGDNHESNMFEPNTLEETWSSTLDKLFLLSSGIRHNILLSRILYCLMGLSRKVYHNLYNLFLFWLVMPMRYKTGYKTEPFYNEKDVRDAFLDQSVSRNTHNPLFSYIDTNMMRGECTLIKKTKRKVTQPVYNLAVETDNSYVANGVVVHNCDDLAETDMFGLGDGVYPPDAVPITPHPSCLCFTTIVIRPKLLAFAGLPQPDATLQALSV